MRKNLTLILILTTALLAGCCGDGICGPGEDSFSCPKDCGTSSVCGDAYCDPGNLENCGTCPIDCGDCLPAGACGNDTCGEDETPVNCPVDCWVCPDCGDGKCISGELETCATCPEDCGECEGDICGDSVCEGDETPLTCAYDCGTPSVCGDAYCDPDNFEDCGTCPMDCGECEGS